MSSNFRQEIEQALMSPHITEAYYEQLRTTATSDLPVQDHIKVRSYNDCNDQ